jgi:hypothetical protein
MGKDETRELGETPELDPTPELGAAAARTAAFAGKSGDDVVALARGHVGEAYIFGARAPMANPAWRGPWDCAEFVSWCVFQATGILYGTKPRNDPMLADAFTGFWAEQAAAGGHTIAVDDAAGIVGAVVLRKPAGSQIGHVVLSDGKGGTVEAHSKADGVIESTLAQRRWDFGILVPGIRYFRSDASIEVVPPAAAVIRLTTPLMRSERIRRIQRRLLKLGFAPGTPDGVYGPQTAHAVQKFQAEQGGLVADGEVGQATLAALGVN